MFSQPELTYKICDFGSSREYNNTTQMTFAGTVSWYKSLKPQPTTHKLQPTNYNSLITTQKLQPKNRKRQTITQNPLPVNHNPQFENDKLKSKKKKKTLNAFKLSNSNLQNQFLETPGRYGKA
eukprot:Pgem_evm1s2769